MSAHAGIDNIAISVFVVILVESDKYWIFDEQACLWRLNLKYVMQTQVYCSENSEGKFYFEIKMEIMLMTLVPVSLAKNLKTSWNKRIWYY